jgi:tetratricopeptide (TPR) repeat protein
MKVLFSPMCEIDDNLKIVVNDKQIFDDEIELNASETFKKTFKNIAKNDAVKICIGNEELYSTTHNYIISRPIKSPANSLENLYVDAVELENRRAYNKALDKYLALLKSEPLHYDALERVAEIYTRRGEYELAEKYLRKALEINTYLPEANFIYGHLMKRANNLTDAEDGFRWAMRSLEFRSAALEQIAEISLTKGNLQLAAEQAEESLSFNKLNINSYKIQAIAKRKLNKTKKAKKALNKLLEIDPLNHFALFEKHLLKSDEKSLNAFNNSFKSEMLKEEYLETGLFYYNIGLND